MVLNTYAVKVNNYALPKKGEFALYATVLNDLELQIPRLHKILLPLECDTGRLRVCISNH